MKEKITILSSFRHPELSPESKGPALRVDCLFPKFIADYDGEEQFEGDVYCPCSVFTNYVKSVKRNSYKYRSVYAK